MVVSKNEINIKYLQKKKKKKLKCTAGKNFEMI